MTAGVLRMRLGALLGLLMASALLATAPAAASASTLEMRGEWRLVLESEGHTVHGVSTVSQEANGSGEFSASALFEGTLHGTFSGMLGATEASVTVTSQAYGPVEAAEFKSSTMQISTGGTQPSLSGSGTLTTAKTSASATLTATRIRTYKEIEEQHEREQREQEEAEARKQVRGEWALTLESGSQVVHGVARVTSAANFQNDFSSSAALFEGAIPGAFSGTLSLQAGKTSVKVETQAAGPYPASTFTSSAITLSSTATSMSMSGSGTLAAGSASVPATLTATRTKDYTELTELVATEKAEAEAKEREALEAKQKQEAIEREAKEKRAAEEAAKLEGTPPSQTFSGVGNSSIAPSAKPAKLASRTATMSSSGSVVLRLTNPNGFAVHGRLTLTLPGSKHTTKRSSGATTGAAGASHASKATAANAHAANAHTAKAHTGKSHPSKGKGGATKGKAPVTLGAASFTIAADGHTNVKVTLSKTGMADLAHSKTLAVVVTVVTQASGEPRTHKSYRLVLHAPSPASHHSKH